MPSQSVSRNQILLQLRNIIDNALEDIPSEVYLFGSWARNEEKRSSDIDIAFKGKEEIPLKTLVELHEKIEESTLPYHVDLVDLSKSDPVIHKKVLEEGIKWRDYKKDLGQRTKH